jgi:hypothetical protein
MENRRLALLVAVVLTSIGFNFSNVCPFVENAIRAVLNYLAEMQIHLSHHMSRNVFSAVASLWIYPFALRLGWLRALVWISLAGMGAGLGLALASLMGFRGVVSVAGDLSTFAMAPVLTLPGVALVGRRSRPWLILAAAAGFPGVDRFTNQVCSRQFWEMFRSWQPAAWGALCSFPYAAILIFGTKLIPKRSATSVPGD